MLTVIADEKRYFYSPRDKKKVLPEKPEEPSQARVNAELTWGGGGAGEVRVGQQSLSSALAQRQGLRSEHLSPRGTVPHLERICQLFLKVF